MDDVSTALRQAWEAVKNAGVPDTVQQVAFTEALRLMARPTTNGTTPDPELYTRIAAATGVDGERLRQVIEFDGGQPRVRIGGTGLSDSKAGRTRTVARLLAVVTVSGLEKDAVSVESIRTECKRLGLYDSRRFRGQLRTGRGGYQLDDQERHLRLDEPALKEFSTLVDRLIDDSSSALPPIRRTA